MQKMTIVRSTLLALGLSAGLAGGVTLAAAEGLPSRGGAFPNIPWAWQGLYGGVHLGSADLGRDDGLVGGVQLGRNWQTGKIIYGVEGDLSLSGADGADWIGTIRGRLGYLLSPNILVYGTAGLGLVDFEHGGTETEFVYGLGVEGKLTDATSLRVEYIGFNDSDVDVVRVGLNFKLNWW
jgi:opacity protein-like surface antigen